MNPLYSTKKQTTLVFLVALGVACFGLSPSMRAVIPAPDGGYGPPAYGTGNTAEGLNALLSLTTGQYNTANGWNSLHHVTSGSLNTGIGAATLFANTGIENTATGAAALFSNTTGTGNTANGVNALGHNTTGFANTAVGFAAGSQQTDGSNNIYISDMGVAGEGNTIAIGALPPNGIAYSDCYIGGIFGNLTPGVPVYINPDGHLSTTASSLRFKDEIKPMDKTSEAIYSLKPVTFRYKKEFDRERIPQFGLIAEEVEKVNPDLIARDGEGRVYSVRYEQVNAMLLNEFLKEHREMQELKKEVAALTAGLQKVSAQLEASKPAPQVVNNP